jgi:hypothetical protein
MIDIGFLGLDCFSNSRIFLGIWDEFRKVAVYEQGFQNRIDVLKI